MFNPRTTTVRRIALAHPEPAIIAEAAAILRRGGLVAFPTETVYGLGANALDAAAVQSIFAAKGRPANNPVIVHVADTAAALRLTAHWPDVATLLAEKFWPGSLTLILPKRPDVPAVVTAGGSTIGLRVPAHPIALELLRAAEIPIAAPSANRSTQISPTTAAHVMQSLDGRIDLVLDGGSTPGGLESTVLDLTTDPPRILRPGLVTRNQLQAVIGNVVVSDPSHSHSACDPMPSPGMLPVHYAPKAKLVCCAADNQSTLNQLLENKKRIGWLRLRASAIESNRDSNNLKIIDMPEGAAAYSAQLYAALHELDDANVDCILVDLPPNDDTWLAVHDRLRRAAHHD